MSEHTTVPNKVIALLIIIALLVTIISTWMVLLKIDSMKPANQKQDTENVASGNLAVTILPNAGLKTTRVSAGQVSLNVNT
jgi:lipopolysaccharide export system protein LptC